MPHVIIVRPEASVDVLEASGWYEQRVSGLGARFLNQIDKAIFETGEAPLQFPIYHRDIRRSRARDFPFGIFFVVTENTVVILAILHLARDPQWIRRTISFR